MFDLPEFTKLFIVFTRRELKLKRITSTYWKNMAKQGNPNDPSSNDITWPAYTSAKDELLLFRPTPALATKVQNAQCDFWDTYQPVQKSLVWR